MQFTLCCRHSTKGKTRKKRFCESISRERETEIFRQKRSFQWTKKLILVSHGNQNGNEREIRKKKNWNEMCKRSMRQAKTYAINFKFCFSFSRNRNIDEIMNEWVRIKCVDFQKISTDGRTTQYDASHSMKWFLFQFLCKTHT